MVLVLAGLVALPAAAAAEEGPLTWVILDQLKSGNTAEWAAAVQETYGPVLAQMIAEGKILSWGLLERESGGSDVTNAGWVTYPGWEAAAAVDQAMGALMGSMSAEDRAKVGATFAALAEPHQVQIRYLRGVVFEVDPAAAPPSYLMVSDWPAGPGMEAKATEMYETVRPAFAQAMADGAITGFGLYVPELHDGGPSHSSWYTLPDLGGIAKVDAAIAAAIPEDMGARMAETFDMAGHRDTLWRVIHMETAGGGGDEGGMDEGGADEGGMDEGTMEEGMEGDAG
jgi:hypothetical protein